MKTKEITILALAVISALAWFYLVPKNDDEPQKKDLEQKPQLVRPAPSMKAAQSQANFFNTTHDAKDYLISINTNNVTFERELHNMLNNGPQGTVEEVDEMLAISYEMLISVRYQIETQKALRQYLEANEGRYYKADYTEALIAIGPGNGFAIGNSCDPEHPDGLLHAIHQGDLDLKGGTLEILDILEIRGNLLNNGVVINDPVEYLEYVTLKCDNAALIIIQQ